jgi:hypothetical protein
VTLVAIALSLTLSGGASASTHHSSQWYAANTQACDRAVATGHVVTAKTFTSCWNGIVRQPAPCLNAQDMPTGENGQLVSIGYLGGYVEYALHVGSKPDAVQSVTAESVSKSTPTLSMTRIDRGCKH